MTPYTIRPANLLDLPYLPAIEKSAAQRFRDSTEAFIADDDGMPLSAFEHHFVRNQIWVAVHHFQADEVDTAEIVGFAIAREIDGQAYLHEIDVLPAHGRRGLGQRLIEAVITWARQKGLPAVTLSTFRAIPWNEPYYAKLGFQPLAEDALGAGLRQVRAHESMSGLDINRRLCMILPLL
ncbi:MAG: GNAT family N-acetyltransferase [Caldilineaceae bacterium]